MAYEEFCAACTYLGESADSYGKYYCEPKGDRIYACIPKCYNFCEAYSRSNYARENMYENSRTHNSSGCYLTTAMCNILGYPDNNYYLQTLRTFRDKTLKQNIQYFPILYTYDTIGPVIAEKLQNDVNKEVIAKNLLTEYISTAVNAIENNKTQEAIVIYTAMTLSLAIKYNINTDSLYINPSSINLENTDINTLGHGRSRIRRLENNI